MTKTMRRCLPAILIAPVMFTLGAIALAETSRYTVKSNDAERAEGAPAIYEAENPVHKLRFNFPASGLVGSPEHPGENPWSVDFRLAGTSFDGRFVPAGSARVSASGERVDYDFGTTRISYKNTPSGLEQVITIAAPEILPKAGAATVVALDLSLDGTLTPVLDGYYVNLVNATGAVTLRYGPVFAEDAEGNRLDAQLVLAKAEDGSVTGARVVITAVDPPYPIEVEATLAGTPKPMLPSTALVEMVGTPVILQAGIEETVEQIMERERLQPKLPNLPLRETHHEFEEEVENLPEGPNAPPPMSHWPPIPESESQTSTSVIGPPSVPQTVGTNFRAISTVTGDSGFIPPDSMGDVGPTQILVHVNGRIKVFDKTGVLGSLNASDSAFWASVAPGGISDPQVRYDRLSGRWFVLAITLTNPNNRIVLAVSSGSTISNVGSFTFYFFTIGSAAPADTGCFCDYPGFGIDANAIYTGCNMFTCSSHQSAFVIRKSSVLSGGPIVVTGFSNIGNAGSPGPYSPRGVDNDDPTATEGYILGADSGFLNTLNIRRVLTPGGTPTLSPTISLTISNTNMLNQQALGSTTDVNTSDHRFYAAAIHKNKLTGASTLWTAHAVETNTTCTPANSGSSRRIGAKWYELGNMTTSPTILQFGTLCTTTPGSASSNSERGFFYPTVAASGQGHMALAASYASAAEFVGVAAAGRLRTDPAGGTRIPETVLQTGLASYTQLDPNRNRWGDYSFTDVDPTDDQTIWTVQEYADTPANNWSIRVTQLKAPPPPTTATAGNPVCNGYAAAPLSITGGDICTGLTCTNGLCTGNPACPEFFDPGPDTGGPGYLKHIQATATGGVTVNSVSIVIPANPATDRVRTLNLSLNTTATTTGTKTLSVVNPDGQGKTYNNVFTIIGNRNPVSNPGGPYTICDGGSLTLNGTGSTDPDSVCGETISLYEWDLNGDAVIDVTGPSPTVTPGQLSSLGLGVGPHTLTLKVTDQHTGTNTVSGSFTILSNGASCSDGNACTQTDSCSAGTCTGANPVVCTASDQCHAVGVCDTGTGVCSNPNQANGSPCNDSNACTQTDTCQTGTCIGSNPVNCSDSNPCTIDGCNIGTGACVHPNSPNGTACSDANACTQSDSCQSGVCTGTNPVVCNASDQCHVAGVCNTGTGVCSNPAAPNGNPCNDSNACTQTDTCQSGICTGSNSVVCTALDQCHVVGTCNTGTGVCSNPNAPNGTGCNDGNACSQTDTCQAGSCAGSNPVICTASDQCHIAGTCNPGTGICSGETVAPDGTTCNDGDATTCGDMCGSAACAGHPVAAPTEIDDSLRIDKTPTDATLTWTDAPGPYGVYRGQNGPTGNPWTYNHTCFAPAVAVPSVVDSGVPAPGVFFYYLVTRYNECRESAPGEDSSLAPIPNNSPCPAP